MSFGTVLNTLGWILVFFAAAMVLPAVIGLGYREFAEAATFGAAALLALFVAGGLIMATRGAVRRIGRREGFLLAVAGWTGLPVFGALPLYFGGAVDDPADAYFEALSGLTTTGATILTAVDETARSLVFWRAEMQWIGGLATIILALALLSHIGFSGRILYRSAMPQGERDTLALRLAYSVRSIWWIYAFLTALCAVLLWLAGMPGFDAVGYAFSTVSSGGFSTRSGSVAAFDNVWIELVLVVFMVVAAVNFTLHWALFHGRPGAYRSDPEFRYFVVLAVAATVVLAVLLFVGAGYDGAAALRHGLFNAISVLTTTGFASVSDAGDWPPVGPFLLLVLLLVGGSTMSTAGGLKLMRLALLFKLGGRELARLAHPHGVVRLRYGGQLVAEPAMRVVWSFFALYMGSIAAVALIVTGQGIEFRQAVTVAAAALANAGPAYDLIAGGAGGYAVLPAGVKWTLAAAMVLGRLELFLLLTLISPAFWSR